MAIQAVCWKFIPYIQPIISVKCLKESVSLQKDDITLK